MVFIPLLLTMIFASVPIGKAVDRFGRRIPLMLGLLAFAFGALIFMIGNLFTVTIAMILFGLGNLLFATGMMALSADLVKPEYRGKVNGFTNFVGYIVMGAGMLLGSYFYESIFPQLPFLTAIALVAPALLVVLVLVREPAKPEPRAQ